jgi:alkanesulfonate monooxygenase SsuD/methylene tetrahydromethanopterin reductase-like flavin-dependent oxidoreductase (luciferase family)
MLEAYTTLGYLAGCTSRAKLLTLVTGAVYRQPGMPAKIVTTLDVLSGGRAWLGIGAAWNEEESRGLGLPFPPVAERFERMRRNAQICLQMWRGRRKPVPAAGTTSWSGRSTRRRRCPPPHPPILIGGSGERKDAAGWWPATPRACKPVPQPRGRPQSSMCLRAHCDAEGRDYDEITKTCYFIFDVGEKGEKAVRPSTSSAGSRRMASRPAIGAVIGTWERDPAGGHRQQGDPRRRQPVDRGRHRNDSSRDPGTRTGDRTAGPALPIQPCRLTAGDRTGAPCPCSAPLAEAIRSRHGRTSIDLTAPLFVVRSRPILKLPEPFG